ncbi:MAG: carbamate kinase [Clostridia bacterium]|nr:carbamate kinase [Clostridia bacterium]
MSKRIVIALGGNALGASLKEQMVAVKETSKAIADLIEAGHEVVVTHGNGPQVGMINEAMSALHDIKPEKFGNIPLSVCVAMSQAYIGYDLQNALREELAMRNINKPVSTVVTQVVVDKDDKGFKNPTKPIGRYLSDKEIEECKAEGIPVMEDAGRGWRKVVASPHPIDIVEIDAVKALIKENNVVITCGGGGIPVIKEDKHYKGVPAVIDKDFASAVLAQKLGADSLIILTAVEKVAINFGKENQQNLDELTVCDAEKYIEEGHFAKGSMLPKVQAALEFVKSGNDKTAIITLLEKAKAGIEGQTGTRIKS